MKQRRKIAVIIQARMRSTRFPGKVMKLLLNKPVLWHVVNRLLKAKYVEEVIVAATNKEEDNVIYDFCVKNNIQVFRGSENDVLDRYYQCAKKYNMRDIVRITADCPLHDPNVIDKVVATYLEGNYDYVTNTMPYSFPDGLGVEVFSFNALEEAWKNAKLPSEREHVTPYIRNNKKFKKKNVYSNKRYPLYRLTLDYPEDYQFIKEIYERMDRDLFHLDDVIKLLIKSPELLKINQNIKFNVGYIKSLIADAKNTIITGERIFLRALKEEDVSQDYCNWLNDPEVTRFLETKGTTIDELKKYVREKKENPYCLFLGIFLKDNGKHIGNIKLEPIDVKNKKTTLGILIGDKKYWGRDICTEAVRLLVDYAFKKLYLEKIDIGVLSENIAAIKCYQKVGFKINKIVPIKNKLCSKVIMSKVKDR
jgi:spore coat polysaccharide biosynthesis protein SpsF (cytidylyltransferase family)